MNLLVWQQEVTKYDKQYKHFDGTLKVFALSKQVADQKVLDLAEYFYNEEQNGKEKELL